MYFARPDLNLFETVTASRHGRSSLSIHPYFGKVDPALATTSIELLSRPGDLVLDPFCGSGTVIHDALRLGRNAIGWDSSPLAILISAGKILGITPEEVSELREFANTVCPSQSGDLFSLPGELDDAEVPSMPRVRAISDWFGKHALSELAHLRSQLLKAEQKLSPVAFLFSRLAFSRIITAASYQKGESSYCRSNKPDFPGRVLRLYLDSVETIITASQAYVRETKSVTGKLSADRLHCSSSGYDISFGNLRVELRVTDSRDIGTSVGKHALADLVTTSPPYLMSWDYGLYHKFRFYWLGFDLDQYEDTEIGRHLRRKDDDIPRYIDDMFRIFAKLKGATATHAHIMMVNAIAVVNGKEVDTNALLTECALRAGWSHVWDNPTLDIPGPHHGMYESLSARGAYAPGSAGKKEHVLVFRKS